MNHDGQAILEEGQEAVSNRDYKYIMQDISTVYIGAKYTYRELLEEEDVPFKLKVLVNRFILPEVKEEELSLESHLYYMEGSGFLYQTFLQLKVRVKISILRKKKKFGGKREVCYTTETVKLQDFVKIPPEEKEKKGILIQEVSLSKLALMGSI